VLALQQGPREKVRRGEEREVRVETRLERVGLKGVPRIGKNDATRRDATNFVDC
jgi:hypothetical protein